MTVEYNKPFTTDRNTWLILKQHFSGICAFKVDNGIYLVKPLMHKYIPIIEKFLNQIGNKT